MSESSPTYGDPHRQAVAIARQEIEAAIATLKANKQHITNGQENAIKRILYGAPEHPEHHPQNGG